MSALGQTRSVGNVGLMSGLPETGNGGTINECWECTPLAFAPALSERRHRSLARRLVAMCPRAVPVVE
jgi:hypothetical protein